jgi:hypothetical protein
VTAHTAEQVRDAAAVLQGVAHDLPKELEDRIVLMLECYASDLDARQKIDDYLKSAYELWGRKHPKS